jgi:hypothetical protein
VPFCATEADPSETPENLSCVFFFFRIGSLEEVLGLNCESDADCSKIIEEFALPSFSDATTPDTIDELGCTSKDDELLNELILGNENEDIDCNTSSPPYIVAESCFSNTDALVGTG